MRNANLPSATEVIRKGGSGLIGQGLADEFAAIGEYTSPALKNPLLTKAANFLPGVGSVAGVAAGVFQVGNGIEDLKDEDPHNNWIGRTGIIGGIATVAGSTITLGTALSVIGTTTAIAGAAPVLLGVGAIAAGGALAYDLLKDTTLVNNINQGIEDAANKPNGFVETAISSGQTMVDKGIPPAIAIPSAIVESTAKAVSNSVRNTVKSTAQDISTAASIIKQEAAEAFAPIKNAADYVSEKAETTIETISSPIEKASNTIADSVTQSITSVSNAIPTFVKDAISSAADAVTKTNETISDTITNGAGKVTDFIDGLLGSGG